MIASLPLAVALSVVFVLTGTRALVRWSATMNAVLPPRLMAELPQPAMSAAMLVMTWTRAGTIGVAAQMILFAAFAGYFAMDAVWHYRTGSYGGADSSAHALMAAALVWMLIAMPLVMPARVSASPPGHGMPAGHGGGAVMDVAAPTGWATVATVGVCVALLATSAFWAARALRGRTVLAGALPAEPAYVRRAAPERDGTRPASAPAAVLAPTVFATAEPAPVAHPVCGSRTDAGGHALMGLGMIAMLLAMVAGW